MNNMGKEDFPQIKRDLISKIDRIEKFITGDPTANPPIKGINERVNNIEENHKNRSRWNLAIIPSVILLIIERLWSHLLGKH